MPVTQEIVATYRGPGKVMQRLMATGAREDRALLIAVISGVLTFVAFTPYQARMAHLDPTVPMMARMYWSAFFWIFIWPLLLYVVATITLFLARLSGQKLSGFGSRIALFWAYIASTPLVLLVGLVSGLIGPGVQLQLVGAIWVAVFLWFWISCLKVAGAK